MAKARQIVRRRRAVTNIKKITQTMQLIATARFQKCLARAAASKPYTEKLTEMVAALSGGEALEHPLLRTNDTAEKSILLIISSNRGLCGGYNASLLRTVMEHRKKLAAESVTPDLEAVGKKAVGYLRFLQVPTTLTITDIEDRIAYARVAEMAERFMKRYESGELRRVDVAYTKFNSISSQKPTVTQLLPIEPPEQDALGSKKKIQFEFSPEPVVLLAKLIPETVKIRLYQCFNDSIVSEQVARMVAMKQATDAAGDMIKYLTRQYNRARQSQITTELADIVGGAEAVK
jgi:F-type H+-transporting ATPase subunit gamma